MRVLVVTNFVPDAAAPQRGRWVLDQVEEMRQLGIEVDVFSFPPGSSHYLPAAWRLRRLLKRETFDLVHVHYGLTAWSALLAGARPLVVTFHGTDVRHSMVGPLSRRIAWRSDLVAAVSRSLFGPEDGRPGLPRCPARRSCPAAPTSGASGPCRGPRRDGSSDLDPAAATCSSPPTRDGPEKRVDRARRVAAASDAELLTGGSIDPDQMPLWVNAANAVLVTSDYEGFGLTCVEALACNVPVLSTPVGIAPFALAGIAGTTCAPFDAASWSDAARPHLEAPDPRVEGAARAASLSAARMAERTIVAYREVLDRDRSST